MKKYTLISLGCPKNLVDSERFASIFKSAGFVHTKNIKQASIILINTCGFIKDAQEEAVNTILECGMRNAQCEMRDIEKKRLLIVTGCLVKRFKEELIKEIPEVDYWLDLKDFEGLNSILKEYFSHLIPDPHSAFPKHSAFRTPHTAFLRVSDGCDNRCTYCAIPDIRGRHISEPIETLIAEAKYLAEQGVKELIINAQDTTLYGADIYGKPMLCKLLKEIDNLNLFKWIRLLYLHPAHLTPETIYTLKDIKSLLPYFDIPLQHINTDILQKMNRKIDKETTIKRLNLLRQVFPNCAIRTTFMTGFPGETPANFKELLTFVKDFKFTRLGVFTYSPETGTPAFDFTPKVSQQTAQRRKDKLMAVQQEISKEILTGYIGKKLDILIEKIISAPPVKAGITTQAPPVMEGGRGGASFKQHTYEGRSYLDAPEIDGKVFVIPQRTDLSPQIKVGDIVPVTITDAYEYDLIGVRSLELEMEN